MHQDDKRKKSLMKITTFLNEYEITRAKMYQEIKRGRLKIMKVGRSTLIDIDDAEAWRALIKAERDAKQQPAQ